MSAPHPALAMAPQTMVWGLAGVALAGGAALWFRHAVWQVPIGILLGGLAWTLFFYAVHRWLWHREPYPGWARRLDDHPYHHAHPDDRSEIEFGVSEMIPTFGGLMLFFLVCTRSWALTMLLGAGCLFGYLVYEWIHFVAHTPELNRSRFTRSLTAHHLRHHTQDEQRCFDILPLWDAVFRTHQSGRST